MKTSYFSKYKGPRGVSIATLAPPWFRGRKYPDLYPGWDMVNQYKSTGEKERFIERYHKEILSKLSPLQVFNDLRGCVLLCWEKPGYFCHRRVVAEWLEASMGRSIPEYKKRLKGQKCGLRTS